MSRWWTRSLLVGLLAAGLTLSAGGQEGKRGKGKRKAKAERVAIVDPAEAKGNIEFQIQGEYEGDVSVRGETHKVGAQVIALGGGKFEIHFLGGGLPGAGWDGEDPVRAEGALKNGKAAFAGKLENGPAFTGEIGGETLTAETEGGEIKATLKKVERKSPMLGEKPPQGAVVLFDGSGAEEWVGGKTVKLSDGTFLDVGTLSKRAFKDFKLHLEFRLAFMPNSRGQARSNSGVYLQDRYECQLLDSFGLKGENNECGGFYQQYAPSVNMCLPPLQWQTYD
ncbi:MAG TPA: DUF1080 domain-containing protein, partial [Gemmataceae bacterium]